MKREDRSPFTLPEALAGGCVLRPAESMPILTVLSLQWEICSQQEIPRFHLQFETAKETETPKSWLFLENDSTHDFKQALCVLEVMEQAENSFNLKWTFKIPKWCIPPSLQIPQGECNRTFCPVHGLPYDWRKFLVQLEHFSKLCWILSQND